MNTSLCTTPRIIMALAISLASAQISHAATTFLWSASPPTANNWNVNQNWTPNTGNPAPGDTAIFGNTGPSTSPTSVNNVVSVSASVNTLQFTNINSGQYM